MEAVLRLVQILEDLQSVGAIELAASTSVKLLNAFNDLLDNIPVDALSRGLASRVVEIAYLVALQLLQLRAAPECTSILQQLGCTYRLSDAVLQWSFPDANSHAGFLHQGQPCTLVPALPDEVFKVLKHGFSASANLWSETGYMKQDSPFSSVLYDLQRDATNAIEAAISSIFQDLKQSHMDMSGILAAEWWAHMRDPTSAHQLHFDLDESRIGVGAAKYRLLHPELSSVLYLSSNGGPTLVLEQSATDTLADQAFLCNPKENVLFCFPGTYLHGVLPGRQPVGSEPGNTQRISLIIAWWGHGMQAKAGAPGTGPCRSLPISPEALLAQHSQTWLSSFPLSGAARPPQRAVEWQSAAPVAPAWVPVARGAQLTGEDAEQGLAKGQVKLGGVSRGHEGLTRGVGSGARTSVLPLPGLRFFLRSADEIRQVYVPQG